MQAEECSVGDGEGGDADRRRRRDVRLRLGWIRLALDATNGTLLWQYKQSIPLDTPLCCGNVNRGVAVANGLVYLATQNGHLVALNATNGAKVWDQVFAECARARAPPPRRWW